jgi:hypothetical protein
MPEWFAMVEHVVLLGGTIVSVPRLGLLKICETFQDNPDRLKSSYHLRSAVGDDVVRRFLAVLDGAMPELTIANINGLFCSATSWSLRRFCRRFQNSGRGTQLSTTKPASAFTVVKSKIEYFVCCKENFGICGRPIFVSRPKVPHLGRRTKHSSTRSVYCRRGGRFAGGAWAGYCGIERPVGAEKLRLCQELAKSDNSSDRENAALQREQNGLRAQFAQDVAGLRQLFTEDITKECLE